MMFQLDGPHEDPEDFKPSVLALAKGAQIFEKHIDIFKKIWIK